MERGIELGAPQESILYDIYTSDVPKGLRHINTYRYADDTANTTTSMNVDQSTKYLQRGGRDRKVGEEKWDQLPRKLLLGGTTIHCKEVAKYLGEKQKNAKAKFTGGQRSGSTNHV